MTEPIAFMTLALAPEPSRLREHTEYLRAVYENEHTGGEFVFGLDTRTDPNTVDLISTWPGAKIVPIEWTNDFSAARNEILRHVEAPLSCYFDPDELPNHALTWFIRERIRESRTSPLGWLFWFRNFFAATNLRVPEVEADWHLRMFQTDAAEFVRPVHELVNIKGVPESESRGRSDLVQKAPQGCFVIHAKPPHLIDADSTQYAAIERAEQGAEA